MQGAEVDGVTLSIDLSYGSAIFNFRHNYSLGLSAISIIILLCCLMENASLSNIDHAEFMFTAFLKFSEDSHSCP